MQRFTTNMVLRDSFNTTKQRTETDEEEYITQEMRKKIQLIKKAFR